MKTTFCHRILSLIVTSISLATFPCLPITLAVAGNLTVTNLSDTVNGDTTNISALKANTGADGISFREALLASNNTSGPKQITFAPFLKGGTVQFAPTGGLLILSSGDLTIDGDVDGDGLPDVTLDGSLGLSGSPSAPGLNIASSNNTIKNLIITNFHGACIQYPFLGNECIANNKVNGNVIGSSEGPSIMLWPCALDLAASPQMSEITYKDIVIADNTITTQASNQPSSAIYVSPALAGGSRNKLINFTITGNDITVGGEECGIDIIVSDVNTTYFNIPGPIQYSNESVIENLTITNNKISSNGSGMGIGTANFGNRNNSLKNLRIEGNTIAARYLGILVSCGRGGYSEKPTSDNLISNVSIRYNTITGAGIGIAISGSDGTNGPPEPAHNRFEDVVIQDNVIENFNEAGIELIGGSVAAGGVLAHTTISENVIRQKEGQSGTGIYVLGGLDSSHQNQVQDIHIRDNEISFTDAAIKLVGGRGVGASGNLVFVAEMIGNLLSNNKSGISVADNEQSAVYNSVFVYPDAPLVDSDMDHLVDAVDLDDDNDGMPDEWESQFGLHPFVNDACVDGDRDGYTNLQEYKSGTDPMDKHSRPGSKDMPWLHLLLEN